MKFLSRFVLALVLSFVLTEAPIIRAQAHAGMIPTSQVVNDLARQENQSKVLKFMDRDDVKKKLISLGVNPSEAGVRIASLSNSDLEKLSGEIDHATAGGDFIIWGLTIVLLVVLIIYLLKRV